MQSVRFVRDSNGDGMLDAQDVTLGVGIENVSGWQLISVLVNSSWTVNIGAFARPFAIAMDSTGVEGSPSLLVIGLSA